MGRIRPLDDALINRIAAGEVVERPASIVKEAVENAIDAGAGRIEIAVEAGGLRKIEVIDDGRGMDEEDARLAIRRHATSKLVALEDLDRISTLGFRGEALASIASVSRFTLRTAEKDGEGVELLAEGGEVVDVRPIAAPRGTTIRAERLFYNVPARRKFLRTESTELQHIVRTVQRFALAYFPLGFLLRSGSRTVLDAPPAATSRDRAVRVLGAGPAAALLPLEWDADGLQIHGFAGRPSAASGRRDRQFLFVNGRAVQDRTLSHAVQAAYENAVPKGLRPPVVLFVELEPGAVDVNVHPQKTEVRFRDGSRLHEAVRTAIRRATAGEGAIPSYGNLRPGAGVEVLAAGGSVSGLETAPVGSVSSPAFEPTVALREPPGTGWWHDGDAHAVQVLGQYHGGYIVAQDDDGLLLVDPHAAHERVLYERFLDDAERRRVDSQKLMFPETVELSVEEAEALRSELDEFRRLGFALEPFGERTVKIEGVPAVAAALDPAGLLREWIGEAASVRSAASDARTLRRKLVTTAACHAAVKLRDRLEDGAMRKLLGDLARCEQSESCPHGRPTRFRLTEAEISRAFRR